MSDEQKETRYYSGLDLGQMQDIQPWSWLSGLIFPIRLGPARRSTTSPSVTCIAGRWAQPIL